MKIHKVFVLAIVAVAAYADALTVGINSPSTGKAVPWRACVFGKVSNPKSSVFVVVHPKRESTYYVEPQPTIQSSGEFSTMVYFAEEGAEYNGERFEVRAVAGPKGAMHEGQELASWPSAAAISDVIEVVRSDAAPSGCGPAAAIPIAIRPWDPPPVNVPIPMQPSNAISIWILAISALCCLLFIALTIVPSHARQAIDFLWTVRGTLWQRWESLLNGVLATLSQKSDAITQRMRRRSLAVWSNHGRNITFFVYIRHLVMWPVLLLVFLAAFYTDTRTLAPGLSLLLPPKTTLLLFDGAGGGPDLGSGTGSGPFGFFMSVAGPLRSAWEAQPLAFALALIQAALGAIMFRGLSSSSILRASFRDFARKRSMLFWVFIALDLTLGVIAGNRGWEFSADGMRWYIPAGVSFVLGLVTPWGAAVSLHFGLDSFAKSLAPVFAAISVLCVFCVDVGAPSLWTFVFPFIWLTPVSAAIFVALFLCLVASFLLWTTIVFHDCVLQITRAGRGNPDITVVTEA